MQIPENVIKAAESRGYPAPIVMAIILELSNGDIFWKRETTYLKPEILAASRITGFSVEEISLFIALSSNYCAAFGWDESTWKTYGSITALDPVNRFLISCKVGLARVPAIKLVMPSELPVSVWEKTIKDFCLDTEKQIDLLIQSMVEFSTPKNEQDRAGILLGISRIFHPEADIPMPITQTLLQRAKFIDQGYQKQKENERLRIAQKSPASPPISEPAKGRQQSVSG